MICNPVNCPEGSTVLIKFSNNLTGAIHEFFVVKWTPGGNLKLRDLKSQKETWYSENEIPIFIENLGE